MPRFWPPGFFLLGENLGENLGEIRGRIPARFWPPVFLLPSENLGEIRGRIAPRFWPPGISLPGENLARIPAREQKSQQPIASGSRQDPDPYFTRVITFFQSCETVA